MNYKLSSEGLSDMPFDKYEKNFTFVVNNQEIKTNRIIADFLSPIIRRSHYSDISNNTFYINIDKQHEQELNQEQHTDQTKTVQDYFNKFLNLINFQENDINSTEIRYYCQFFYELGNIDEYFRLQPSYLTDLTTDNVITRLQTLTRNDKEEIRMIIRDSEIYHEMIKYISTNFSSIEQESMKSLSTIELERIIQNERMTIHNEDELFEFILSLYKEDPNKSFLFDYVIFRNLSQKSLDEFIENFDRLDLDEEIWRSICSVVSFDKNKNITKQERYKEPPITAKTFEYDNSNRFNGILKYLSDESQGNILDNGTVGITATSIIYPLRNLVDFQSTNYFRSKDDIQTICFDFKERQIQMTNYSIQTGTDGTNLGHLKSWSIEGSKDGEEWYEIDSRENEQSLNGKNKSSTFNVKHSNNEFYRFIRLRQNGYPWAGDNRYIEINYIEFYGKLKESQNK